MAMKSYELSKSDSFYIEQEALAELSNDEAKRSIVQYLGSFSYEEERDGRLFKTYNLLLEYGEFDLDEYFIEMPPPSTADDIIAFWRNLFDIADALMFIHNFEYDRSAAYSG
jgi:hypothetical protein